MSLERQIPMNEHGNSPLESRVEVSVIIPAFNARKWIEETLRSVYEMQKNVSLEVILVDDGSTDQTASFVEEKFPQTRIIKTSNLGASAARNMGTSYARGEYIQYLDADDILMPDKLEKQVNVLKERADVDVVYGKWKKIRKRHDGIFVEDLEIQDDCMADPKKDMFLDFWAPLAVYLFRRSIVSRVSWHPKLIIWQDARFLQDCALASAKFEYLPIVLAIYRQHDSGSLSTDFRLQHAKDALLNAEEIQQVWESSGEEAEYQKKALLTMYSRLARLSFGIDSRIFDQACVKLNKFSGGKYIPEKPKHLRLASKLMGYRNAEFFAFWYRLIKKSLKSSEKEVCCVSFCIKTFRLLRNMAVKFSFAIKWVLISCLLTMKSIMNREFYFIQIGSNDGKTLDPIYPFIQKYSWKGILVEPVAELRRRLMETYKTQLNLVFESNAIADQEGIRDFYRIPSDDGNDEQKWYSLVGSLSKKTLDWHAQYVPDFDSRVVTDKVHCITFSQLLKKYSVKQIDMLHMDVEGYDYEIIKTIKFTEIKPRIIMYEHCHLSEHDRGACETLLAQQGYRLVFLQNDTVALLRPVILGGKKKLS